MQRTRLATMALLTILGLAGTGCDDNNAFPDSPLGAGGLISDSTGVISGQATAAGIGVGGAQIQLNTNPLSTTLTDAQGQYRFPSVRSGTYLVSIVPPLDYRLAPSDSTTQTATVRAGRTVAVSWQLERVPRAP